MKILYLTHQYLPAHIGGTELYTRSLARRTMQAGHEVLIATPGENTGAKNSSPRDTEYSRHDGIRVAFLPLSSNSIHSNSAFNSQRAEFDNADLRAPFEILLRDFSPDAVHVMHAMNLSSSVLEACHDAEIPMIVTLCDFWFLCRRYTLLKPDGALCSGPDSAWKCINCARQSGEFARFPRALTQIEPFARNVQSVWQRKSDLQKTLLKAQRIIALTPFARQMFIENGYPAERIEVIAHGLEQDDLKPEFKPELKPVSSSDSSINNASSAPLHLGFIGTLAPHKGAHLLLEALQLAPQANLRCSIYGPLDGDAEYLRRLRELAAGDERIVFVGEFQPEKMGEILIHLDVLAMPVQWYENYPLVMKAALQMGVPVLASRIGSLREMIEEDRNGWLLDPTQPALWAKKIIKLAAQPPPKFAPTPLKNMDENAREMLQIYETLSGEKSLVNEKSLALENICCHKKGLQMSTLLLLTHKNAPEFPACPNIMLMALYFLRHTRLR